MHVRWIFLAVAAMALAINAVEAKGCARCRLAAAWGMASQPDTFDADNIVSVKGDVISVQDIDPEKELVAGEYLLITADDRQWPVRLGPKSYLKKKGMALEPYDEVVVQGAKMPCGEKTGIVCTRVQKGDKTVSLRDDKGKALWK